MFSVDSAGFSLIKRRASTRAVLYAAGTVLQCARRRCWCDKCACCVGRGPAAVMLPPHPSVAVSSKSEKDSTVIRRVCYAWEEGILYSRKPVVVLLCCFFSCSSAASASFGREREREIEKKKEERSTLSREHSSNIE